MADITQLLGRMESGDRGAFDELLRQVYPALRQIARARLRESSGGETLNATGLVHEAYLRMVRYQEVAWQGRSHFFGAAAQTMRRILIERARAKARLKRSGEHVTLSHAEESAATTVEGLLELDDLLRRLEEINPRWVRVIECRHFAGLTLEETAEAVGVSHATVSNDWRLARAWLRRELSGAEG